MLVRLVRTVLLTLVVVHTLPASAQPEDPARWCGTSDQQRTATRALASWTREKHAVLGKIQPTAIRESSGLFILEPDELTTPFDNPIDLAGTTLTFSPASSSTPSTWTVRKSSLEYDAGVGQQRVMPQDGRNDYVLHPLENFEFPFQGQTIRNLYISERFGVFLAAPEEDQRTRLGPLDIVTGKSGVIAPYLHPALPRTLGRTTQQLFVKESSDAVTITWRAFHDPLQPFNPLNDGELDIQMVMRADGTIRFSYRTLTNIAWGAVVITSGQEHGRQNFEALASASDPVGDVTTTSQVGNLLDIRQVEIQRVDGSELIRVKLRLGGRLLPSSISGFKAITVRFSEASALSLTISGSLANYCIPGWGCGRAGSNVEFLADSVVFHVLDHYLNTSPQVVVETRTSFLIDSLTVPLTDLGRGRATGTDLSSLAAESTVSAPVLEAFTLPILNPEEVWTRLREQYGLWDSEVDGVAIFQNFTTDIRTYATAYSTVGNSQAGGVWSDAEEFYGPQLPRSPALLHMNEVEPDRWDVGSLRYRDFLLGHELGHRWLYGFRIAENGSNSRVLGPDGGHPAQYVHTPAAFPVYTNRDYSVMGGSDFEDLGSGRFRTPLANGAFGYSWHELYLMGLAATEEVPAWFYLADSDPELGRSYNPPNNFTITARKVTVGLHQMTEAMGPRAPGARDSQRLFRVLFVLLEKPGSRTSEEEAILAEYASRFPVYFSTATGARGAITSSLPSPPVAGFTAPQSAAAGRGIVFRDTSSDYPATWSWNFGDGSTSTSQFPTHAFAAGNYIVTLTVRNSRGTSTTTRPITIEPARRRAVRR